jgi:hypothetical protein
MVSKQVNEDNVTAEGVVAVWSCSGIFKKWYVCTTYNSYHQQHILKLCNLSSNYYSSCV